MGEAHEAHGPAVGRDPRNVLPPLEPFRDDLEVPLGDLLRPAEDRLRFSKSGEGDLLGGIGSLARDVVRDSLDLPDDLVVCDDPASSDASQPVDFRQAPQRDQVRAARGRRLEAVAKRGVQVDLAADHGSPAIAEDLPERRHFLRVRRRSRRVVQVRKDEGLRGLRGSAFDLLQLDLESALEPPLQRLDLGADVEGNAVQGLVVRDLEQHPVPATEDRRAGEEDPLRRPVRNVDVLAPDAVSPREKVGELVAPILVRSMELQIVERQPEFLLGKREDVALRQVDLDATHELARPRQIVDLSEAHGRGPAKPRISKEGPE